MAMAIDPALAPVVKTLSVKASPERAFDVFANRMDQWWPLHRMAVSPSAKAAPAVSVTVEPRIGGRIYETAPDGEQFEWGIVSVWEPGKRLEFSWRPGLPREKETRVDVRFEAEGEGCRVTLVHDGWDKRPGGAQARPEYDPGWDYVFGECFGACLEAARSA